MSNKIQDKKFLITPTSLLAWQSTVDMMMMMMMPCKSISPSPPQRFYLLVSKFDKEKIAQNKGGNQKRQPCLLLLWKPNQNSFSVILECINQKHLPLCRTIVQVQVLCLLLVPRKGWHHTNPAQRFQIQFEPFKFGDDHLPELHRNISLVGVNIPYKQYSTLWNNFSQVWFSSIYKVTKNWIYPLRAQQGTNFWWESPRNLCKVFPLVSLNRTK